MKGRDRMREERGRRYGGEREERGRREGGRG